MRKPFIQRLQPSEQCGAIHTQDSQCRPSFQTFLDDGRKFGFRSPRSPLLKFKLAFDEPFQASRKIGNLLSLRFDFGADGD